MVLGFLVENLQIPKRKFFALVFLFSSSFAWFLVFYNRFDEIFSSFILDTFWLNIGNALFLIFVVISSMFGSFLAEKVNRRRLLFWLTVFGILSSIPIIFFRDTGFFLVTSCILGISFGTVYPMILSYLTDSTRAEERGRVSGLLILSIFIIVFLATLFLEIFRPDATGVILFSIFVKMTGFFAFFLDSMKRKAGVPDSWKKVLTYRSFALYLLAYVLFNICSGLVTVIWSTRPDELPWITANANASILRPVGIAVIAVISGFFADKIGRKKPVIVGLILLGISYALVSLEFTPDTFFAQYIISGLAWGILIVMYTTIPGDLASVGSAEKFYTLGVVVPFILYTTIHGVWRFIEFPPKLDVFSTILSMALFLSIIPILYAAESLSESIIQEVKLKEYTKKVREVVQDSEKT